MFVYTRRYLCEKSTLKHFRWPQLVSERTFLLQNYGTTSFRLKNKNGISQRKLRYEPTILHTPKKSQISPQIQANVVSSNSTPYQTFATTLAQKTHPTLLYRAPSSSAYQISSYAAATLCLGYGILSYWNNYLCAPPDIAIWIPYAFAGISLITILFGIRFLRNPLRLVRSMTAIPKRDATKPTLEIKIELKRMFSLPFFTHRVLCVAPTEIVIPKPLAPLNPRVLQLELRRQRMAEILRRKEEIEYDRSHIMSIGIRHLWRAISKMCSGIFRATQRAFTKDNFVEMRIRGKIYKLDFDDGWVLDHGKAIDRLVTLEPSSHLTSLHKLT